MKTKPLLLLVHMLVSISFPCTTMFDDDSVSLLFDFKSRSTSPLESGYTQTSLTESSSKSIIPRSLSFSSIESCCSIAIFESISNKEIHLQEEEVSSKFFDCIPRIQSAQNPKATTQKRKATTNPQRKSTTKPPVDHHLKIKQTNKKKYHDWAQEYLSQNNRIDYEEIALFIKNKVKKKEYFVK